LKRWILTTLVATFVAGAARAADAPALPRRTPGPLAVAPAAPEATAAARAADAPAAPAAKNVGYDDTPLQPNGRWRVHDGTRPLPRVVTPGTQPAGARPGTPPSDAVVLVGPGGDLSGWQHPDGSAVTWRMKNGVLQTGKGSIATKQRFQDFQLHVEWASPKKVDGEGQGRGNSGVFLLGAFEIQILDSFNNVTYADGQAASMYGQYPPLVNACRKPGEWQAYDIVFTAPRFKGGKLDKPAMVTVLQNGVAVHHAQHFHGPTSHRQIGPYKPEHADGPIRLQDHGHPVSYRNLWLRPLKGYDEQ
jgi:hypothetical protein